METLSFREHNFVDQSCIKFSRIEQLNFRIIPYF